MEKFFIIKGDKYWWPGPDDRFIFKDSEREGVQDDDWLQMGDWQEVSLERVLDYYQEIAEGQDNRYLKELINLLR